MNDNNIKTIYTMKRVKLFALISLLFIGLGHAWGAEAILTQAEIKKATAGGSYAERTVESTSGTWTGQMIINTSTGFVQINKNSNNYYLGSPTFEGGVTKIVITTCNSTDSGRTFYIMGNTNTAQPTSGTMVQVVQVVPMGLLRLTLLVPQQISTYMLMVRRIFQVLPLPILPLPVA